MQPATFIADRIAPAQPAWTKLRQPVDQKPNRGTCEAGWIFAVQTLLILEVLLDSTQMTLRGSRL